MDKIDELVKLGEAVKQIRLKRDLTQTELAHKIGKDHPSINKLENGKVNPSYFFLLEVCQGLDVTLCEVLSFEQAAENQ